MAISMLKIRRPLGRLIFNMGIAIPGKTVFLIETPPCFLYILNISYTFPLQTFLSLHSSAILDNLFFETLVSFFYMVLNTVSLQQYLGSLCTLKALLICLSMALLAWYLAVTCHDLFQIIMAPTTFVTFKVHIGSLSLASHKHSK